MSQTDHRFRLVVSDNSSTDELRKLIDPRENLVYIKRPKVFTGIDHGNICLSEITTEYFTFFHDDDLMLPNYVADFWRAQSVFPTAVAFGANALVECHGKFTGLSFKSARHYVSPITPDNLLRRYFSHHHLGIAPLPSYIYKKEALQNLRFDVSGGKYSDVQWLSSWAARGLMIWIAEPTMVYRLHESNDGNFESRHDRLRFLAYLKSSRNIFSPEILSDYRFFLYKKFLPSLKAKGHEKVHHLLSQFISVHRYQRLCRLSFYQALINKALIKFFLSLNKKV
ncbi:Group 2 family glycosyl transferase [beta proteobacterium CB]|nr:Group 2 family glycosyl transferase [beta proteobacterium CB]